MGLFSKHLVVLTGVVSFFTLAGCGSDSNNGTTGKLSLNITDAPVDNATEVVVEFTGVSIKPAGGPAVEFEFDEPRSIDLLQLQNGTSEPLLDSETVEAGEYNWVRLHVNALNGVMDSYISFEDGSSHSLYVPSGSQSGLQLSNGFNIAVGQSSNFTIDFDLRKSITNPSSAQVDYILKPSLRILDNTEIGDITGTVANATMEQEACANGGVVYVYEGLDVVADDLGSATEPLTSANVSYNEDDNTYEFFVAYLSPTDYTLSLTCEAALDDPEVDDEITFLESINASVEADTIAEVSFN
ncbi:DUF4382 domain-containing protein [Pleionea sediminis]|uniref:DUF4382 domain-containing protein n=1 Tax=Pleionea sediminis TaxID=2569479 RepID=UPI001185843B|nr:DUF4382 domain-containing protein [Pleionea sediminis]